MAMAGMGIGGAASLTGYALNSAVGGLVAGDMYAQTEKDFGKLGLYGHPKAAESPPRSLPVPATPEAVPLPEEGHYQQQQQQQQLRGPYAVRRVAQAQARVRPQARAPAAAATSPDFRRVIQEYRHRDQARSRRR
jgi:hypothetical protein